MVKKHLFILVVLLFGIFPAQNRADAPLQVVTTTGIIADVVQNVGGEWVEVVSIVPAEADPHTYAPAPQAVAQVVRADVVFINGMNLEESLLDIIEQTATVVPVVVSIGVPVLGVGPHDDHDDDDHDDSPFIGVLGEAGVCGMDDDHDAPADDDHDGDAPHDHGPCDPHVWMNPANVIVWAENIAAALSAADPDNAAHYAANAEAYIAQLEALDAEITAWVETVPEENRVLLTNHEFLSYFAVHYGFENAGTILPGAGTAADVDPRTLAGLIDRVNARHIPAIFGEFSVNSDLTETIAAETRHEVQVVTLYTGSLSAPDGDAPTYLDYMRHNARLIVTALGGEDAAS